MKLYHNDYSDTKLAINDIHVCPENMSVNIISFHTLIPSLSPLPPPPSSPNYSSLINERLYNQSPL